MSVVDVPFYDSTNVVARNKEEFIKEKEKKELQLEKEKLKLMLSL